MDIVPALSILPPNEEERLAALHRYALLDSAPETNFDNLAHIIADDFHVPIALISLVDRYQVFFKANVGLKGVKKADREVSLCSIAVLADHPTVFENTLEEPCLMANPLVHGELGVRFYAGAPLITPDGYNIGVVCIVDKNPRVFSEREKKRLERYAQAVMHEIGTRLALKEKVEALDREMGLRHKMITQAVIRVQEEERAQLGRELHDNVNQVLTTIKLYNELLQSGIGDREDTLHKSTRYLQDCINEVRSISKRLSAPTLGQISLEESVHDLIESINLTRKLQIVSDVRTEGRSIPQDLHLAVYRILQEHLNNVLTHAGASIVLIQLLFHGNNLELSIDDNGKGFHIQEKKAGIGIINMRTRVESFNGTFLIESAPGKGCTLKVSFPQVVDL